MVKRVRILSSDLSAVHRSVPLDLQEVERLNDSWGSEWDLLWNDISSLASDFMSGSHSGDTTQMRVTWHHLVLSVGNFKRQAGTIHVWLDEVARASEGYPSEERPVSFRIPGTSLEVVREDPNTWSNLGKAIKGMGGVPTATTLLSALWPDRHVILDIRDVRASVGLLCGQSWATSPLDEAHFPDAFTWSWYVDWVRPLLIESCPSGMAPIRLERALFFLDDRTNTELSRVHGSDWRWSQYKSEAENQLKALVP